MLFFALLLFVSVQAAYEGDFCDSNGAQGTCSKLRNCPSAIEDIKNRRNPKICTFEGMDPIVCCVSRQNIPPVLTTSTRRTPSSTTEYIPPVYDYVDVTENKSGGCEPIPPSLTAPRTGQKAWDKCLEYQEKYVFPCGKSMALSGEQTRTNNCKHNADELIVGGSDASENEFPHMALLGFADDQGTISWQCGGALISDKFVLTAGHCIADRIGPVTDVLIGSLRKTNNLSGNNHYKVARIIPYPDYHSPIKYNDIALLELDRPVKLDQFTVPACLHVGDLVDDNRASATGWGVTEYRGNLADVLQKVILTKFTPEECAAKYPPFRQMKNGYDLRTQMCYGDRTKSKDTCQGDSGGPLQIKSKKIYCMYTIIGVTSFGRACGFKGEPGIYTRVAPYVPWIESVVWPN